MYKEVLSKYENCSTQLHVRISESLVQFGQAHEFRQLLEEDLNKYPA